MWQLIKKQIWYNFNILLGVFLSLLASAILIGTFSLLLSNIIYAIIYANELHINKEAMLATLSLTSILIVISFFIGISALYSTIVLSVKLRWQQFIKLRIIGITNSKLKTIICGENLIFAVICIIIGLFLSIPLANLLISLFRLTGLLDPNFHIYYYFWGQWIYVLGMIILILLITYCAILPLRKIDKYLITGEAKKVNKIKVFFALVCGLTCLAGALALTLINNIMQGSMGVGMIILAIFCYLFAFGFMGKIILQCLLFFSQKIFAMNYLLKLSLSAIKQNLVRVFLPLTLIVSLFTLINYSYNINDLYMAVNNSNDSLTVEKLQQEKEIWKKINSNEARAQIIKIDNAIIKNQNQNALKIFSFIFAGIVLIFNLVVGVNAIWQYFLSKKKYYHQLSIIGLTRTKIFRLIIYESLFFTFISIIFGFLPMFYFNLRFALVNNLGMIYANNIELFWGINIILFVIIFIVCLLPNIYILFKRKKG